MPIGIEGTICVNCSHKEVCSLKDQFAKAQKAIDDVSVTLGSDENAVSFKKLRDYDWIKKVKLECTHFLAKQTMRDSSYMENRMGISP